MQQSCLHGHLHKYYVLCHRYNYYYYTILCDYTLSVVNSILRVNAAQFPVIYKLGSYFTERWWVNIIKKIYEGFFNNYCFPMYNSFVTYSMLLTNFSEILAWKLFRDFSSTARHNYPLYLHNVKLIALTFQVQYQKLCDDLNWALPCDQTRALSQEVGNSVYISYSLKLAFTALYWSTCIDYLWEGKKKNATTRVILIPSTTVTDILLHNKASLILRYMSIELFTEENHKNF